MDSLPLTKTRPRKPEKDWPDNDQALLEFAPGGKTDQPENWWSLSDAFQGVQVLGGTGSGKSSGSGQALARAFLEANLGGLVLTAKTDEVFAWMEYAEATGRGNDLLVINAAAKDCFNFLSYELNRGGAGAGHTENLVNLFCSVLEASERRHGQGGGGDAYWQRTLKQLLRNAIDLAVLAVNDVDLPSLYRIITSAPRTPLEALDAAWQGSSVCYGLMDAAEEGAKQKDRNSDFELNS